MNTNITPYRNSFAINHFGYNGLLVISLAGQEIIQNYQDTAESDQGKKVFETAMAFLAGLLITTLGKFPTPGSR